MVLNLRFHFLIVHNSPHFLIQYKLNSNPMSESNSLENTSELNFKFQEASSELHFLRTQYTSQSITVQKLEEELMQKQSTIESLKLALNYNSSYEIAKELDYKNRIEELEKSLKTN